MSANSGLFVIIFIMAIATGLFMGWALGSHLEREPKRNGQIPPHRNPTPQPAAIRHAEMLENGFFVTHQEAQAAADELRRLHSFVQYQENVIHRQNMEIKRMKDLQK